MIMARGIGDVLIDNPKHIGWDRNGILNKPSHIKGEELHLYEFVKTLIYTNHGSARQIANAAYLIRPFYNKIEKYIKNKSIIKKMSDYGLNARALKYESFI